MALIRKVEPQQEKHAVSAGLDEEAHILLQRYAAFLGGARHENLIGESLERQLRRDTQFNDWLEKNHKGSTSTAETPHATTPAPENTTKTAPTAA